MRRRSAGRGGRVGAGWLAFLVVGLLGQAVVGAGPVDADDRPVVYLTFDDGPSPAWTPAVLDLLDRYDATATFFVVGDWAERYPWIVTETAGRGHSVQNHGADHRSLLSLSDAAIADQIRSTDDTITRLTGVAPGCVRPPFGLSDERVAAVIASLGHTEALWDVSVHDWAQPGVDTLVDRLIGRIGPGSVVLLHDGPYSEDRAQTVVALDRVLGHYRDLGYRFEAMPECESGEAPRPTRSDGSVLRVLANGSTGEERLDVLVDGVVVATLRLGSVHPFWGIPARWGSYVYHHLAALEPDQVRLRFANDGRSVQGDRNVRVDAILIDGERFEAEGPDVYSVGSWGNGARCDGGFHRLDNLVCAGYLQFGADGSVSPEQPATADEPAASEGSTITVTAAGATGEELLEVSVDGEVVATVQLPASSDLWTDPSAWHTTTYQLDAPPSVVRLTFTNDGRSASGDRDVRVDAIEVDGVRVEAEGGDVFSTGSWSETARCRGGFHRLDNLACTGYFEFRLRS